MDGLGSAFGQSIAILEKLSGSSEVQDLNHIAKAVGSTPVAVRRLLKALVEDGFATYDETLKAYCVGANALHFSSLIRRRYPIERIARPILRQIAAATGETVTLNVYVPEKQSVICTAIEESQMPLQYVVRIGEHRDLLDGANGKAIAIFLTPEQRASLLSEASSGRVRKQADNQLEKDWIKSRTRGYILSDDKQLPGAMCLSAPVFSSENIVVASVVVIIPEHRYKKTTETRLAKSLLAQVARISFMLGHSAAAENTARG
jgi:DNA-binding IclR family transcriptional regulator